MSQLPDKYHQDRALRDAARAVLAADLEHAKTTLSGRGVATRVAGRIGDGAKDVLEVAIGQAEDNRGILAALVAAVFLWFARAPLLELLGFASDANEEDADETGVHNDTDDASDPSVDPLNEQYEDTLANAAR